MDTSVNVAFTGKKLNTAKVMLTLLTVDTYTINAPNIPGLVLAITMEHTDKENYISVIDLH